MRNHQALEAVQARRDQIARELEELQSEDAQLAVAEHALTRLYGAAAAATERPSRTREARQHAPQTQREVVLQVLRDASVAWLPSGEIVEAAKIRWNIDVPEKSLRPLLSVMKNEGEIVRRRRLIALPTRANEPEQRRAGSRRASLSE